jgi:hypothetical protein
MTTYIRSAATAAVLLMAILAGCTNGGGSSPLQSAGPSVAPNGAPAAASAPAPSVQASGVPAASTAPGGSTGGGYNY